MDIELNLEGLIALIKEVVGCSTCSHCLRIGGDAEDPYDTTEFYCTYPPLEFGGYRKQFNVTKHFEGYTRDDRCQLIDEVIEQAKEKFDE